LKQLQKELEDKVATASETKAAAEGLNAEIAGLQGAIADVQKNLDAFRTDHVAIAQQLKEIKAFWKLKSDQAKHALGPKAAEVDAIIKGYDDDTTAVQDKIDVLVPEVNGTSQKDLLDEQKARVDAQARYMALQVNSIKATIQKLQAWEKEVDGYGDKPEDLPKMYFLLELMKKLLDDTKIDPDVKTYEASLVGALERYTAAVNDEVKAKATLASYTTELAARTKQLQDLQNKRKENVLALLKDVGAVGHAKASTTYPAAE